MSRPHFHGRAVEMDVNGLVGLGSGLLAAHGEVDLALQVFGHAAHGPAFLGQVKGVRVIAMHHRHQARRQGGCIKADAVPNTQR